VLPIEHLQTRDQFLEGLLCADDPEYGYLLKCSAKFKGSTQFMEILQSFINDLPNRWIDYSDVYYDGKNLVSRQLLKDKMIKANKASLLKTRLERLENHILELVHQQRQGRMEKLEKYIMRQSGYEFEVEAAARMLSIHESTVLIKQIRKFTELDHLELYRRLFSNKDYFHSLAQDLELPDCIDDIIDLTCKNLKKDGLNYDDAPALAFLKLETQGYTDYQGIKQVVIDEAQDYNPIHYAILNSMFPKARYTVVGDVDQTIGKQEDVSFYEQIAEIFDKKKSTLVTLEQSFRCTNEILTYSTRFLDPGFEVNNFNRKGDTPAVVTAPSRPALDNLIVAECATCKEMDYKSIALICKTEQDAVALYERLAAQIDAKLITSDMATDLSGVFILPLYMAKGLEFDAVLVSDVDKDHYQSEDDKNLLYIACTRALHRLNLFYSGEISPLL
jgi:DNA helicase-2/ATP-dependent DNA helicase PcrA